MTGLLVWDYWTPRPAIWQYGCAVVVMVAAYSLIAWWLRANRSALQREDRAKQERQTMPRRDVPLSSLQAHYLTTMEHYTKR
ncbi:MAG: hypothetical protein H0X37_26290 [Herpetosiphonaceae bacterium]|nr:hypothetical protein [Herpetosiphonaceae bacterium]